MVTKYRNEQWMKICTILGGLIGLAFVIIGFARAMGVTIQDYGFVDPNLLIPPIELVVGLVVVALTLLVGIKPDDPIPFHWIVLFILGVLLVVFGAGIWACALLIIAALLGIIEAL